MPTQTRSSAASHEAARARRAERAQTRLNRAQVRAMEVRSAETVAAPTEAGEGVVAAPTAAVEGLRPRAAAAKRAVARPVVLTREREYQYVRSDLRRLGLTAGPLFVVMIVLLVVV